MDRTEILQLIDLSKKVDIDSINSSDEKIDYELKVIFGFIKKFEETYSHLIQKLCNSKIRFSDYYDSVTYSKSEIIDYFENSYDGIDKEELVEIFALYVFLKNAMDLLIAYSYGLFNNYKELYDFLNNGTYFDDILYMIDYVKKCEMSVDDVVNFEFMNSNNKYKIFFSGLTLEDIGELPKHMKKAFINNLAGHLSTSDYVPRSEGIECVRETYDCPMFRTHLCYDYRIAYLRKDGVTAILGVCLKTGNDSDYTRYCVVGADKNELYDEISKFNSGELPSDAQHYKVISTLESFVRKNRA